jgi:hypothetical protein
VIGKQFVAEPTGTMVGVFSYGNTSGNHPPQTDQSRLGVMRSTGQGANWSASAATRVQDP